MRTKPEIMKDIELEKERAAAKVAELQEQQKESRKMLEQANERYLEALASFSDDAEIAMLQGEVETIKRTIKLTDDTIQVLAKNPRIQALEAERVALFLDSKQELEQRAQGLYESLKPHYEALIGGIDELNKLYHKWYSYRSAINEQIKELPSAHRESLGLTHKIYDRNPVAEIINSLLVERTRGFRQ
ncbi:hypothetical protein [Brevibacillus sp. NRS-1366]|uniref:hypothetical protein n=1 Tax=Brevibacillus sp. NRS-1366 TaxID=3233899 RepID=UPI003D21E4F0